MPLARPLRTRLALTEDARAAPIELPRRGTSTAGLVVAGMFAASAAAWIVVIHGLHFGNLRDVGDLVSLLFRLFWVVGWSLGVAVLGLLTVLFLFYREFFYVADGRLVSASRIGPLRMLGEYDIAGLRDLRLEPDDKDGVRVRFDYGDGTRTLGDVMPRAEADRIVTAIRAAMPTAEKTGAPKPAPDAPPAKQAVADLAPAGPASTLALVAANLVPLAGVLLAGWRLDQVMVLFWAESAVVALYTLAKMAAVGRWLAIPAGMFFLAHFGAFMAIHFLFIYELFVRGPHAAGHEPALGEALSGVFFPLWPALLALFLSHGVSFVLNFYARGERRALTLTALMAAPYNRLVLMHLTLLFGGWIILAAHDPRPALAILVLLKIVTDSYAHRRERSLRSPAGAKSGL
jgi:hypothetical protein